MVILFYIAKVVIISALLYGYYHLALRNRGYHRFNRVYLLLSPLVAFLMPLVQIPVRMAGSEAGSKWVETLRVINTGVFEPEGGMASAAARGAAGWWSLGSGWWTPTHLTTLAYIAGLTVAVLVFVRSLIYIAIIRRRYAFERVNGVRLYNTHEPGAPFSFFRSIFWLEGLGFETREGQQIFRHELFHVTQRHSADNLFIELCCIFFWFNPFFYLVRRELRAVHEFLADDHAIGRTDGLAYAELLVMHAIETRRGNTVESRAAGVASPMFQQTIKRRIMMITKKTMMRTRQGYLGRLLVLPVVAALFCSLSFKVAMDPTVLHHQPVTVVIDAAHGGIDAGAPGAGGGADEKVLALQLAKKIQSMADAYHIKVVMTREDDALPGGATDKEQGLKNRVTIAGQAGATMFVSLHVNNAGGGTPGSGFQAFVSKRRDFKSSEALASAILTQTAGIYATQNAVLKRDEGIYVLDHTSCAAVLIECGFIDNPSDVAFFNQHQEAIARSILQGIADAAK